MNIRKHLEKIDEGLYDAKVNLLSQLFDQLENYHSLDDVPQQVHIVMDVPQDHGPLVVTPDKGGATIEEPDESDEVHRVGRGESAVENEPGEKEAFSLVEKDHDCQCGLHKDGGAGGGPFVDADSPITRQFPAVDLTQKDAGGGFAGTALGVASSGFVDTGGHVDKNKNRINPTETIGSISKEHVKAAGLAVVAKDTGRVLLQQRALKEDDNAAGKWEFPGGHMEGGEEPLQAAIREWQEETGAKLPKGEVARKWEAPNGYQGFVYVVDSESDIPLNLDPEDRKILNPDDPDKDNVEVVSFWEVGQMKNNPALRREMRGMDLNVLGNFSKAVPHLKIMKSLDDKYVIYGLASSSVLDKQGHVISNAALKEAVPKFMSNGGFNLLMVFHSDIAVGRVIPEFMASDGTLYRTEVDDKGWWIVCELRKDIVASQNLIKEIEKGEVDAFSIAGNALQHHVECASHGCYTIIDALEIYEVSACKVPVNETSHFTVINRGLSDCPKCRVDNVDMGWAAAASTR